MTELILFNNLINPNDIKCYHKKTRGIKGNYYKEEVEYFSLNEIFDIAAKNPNMQFGIDLSLIDAFFIDCDSAEDQIYLDEELKNSNYIKITSIKEGRCHYYFKHSENIEPGIIENTTSVIFDWYKRGHSSPYSPVIPINNSREIVLLPDELGFFPEHLFIQKFDF